MLRATTAFALRIEPTAMVREKAVTDGRPETIDLRFKHIAAKVLTFIPPAVDCEPPPIHIRNITTINVAGRNPAGFTEEKPALLGVAELNTDWVIFQRGSSLQAYCYTRAQKMPCCQMRTTARKW